MDELNIEKIEVLSYEDFVPFEHPEDHAVASLPIEKLLSLSSRASETLTRHQSSNPSTLGRASFMASLATDARRGEETIRKGLPQAFSGNL